QGSRSRLCGPSRESGRNRLTYILEQGTASMRRLNWKSTASYVALLTGAYVVALFFSWFFGPPTDDYAYDMMFKAYRATPWQPEIVLLAIDELTLADCGGIRGIRGPLARALRLAASAKPSVVALDVI